MINLPPRAARCLGCLAVGLLLGSDGFAQQMTLGFPAVSTRHGFSEGINTNWALTGPGASSWFKNNSGSGIPQFGGFTPNAGLSGGFGVGSGPFGARLGFNFAQGSNRSMVSQTPFVTGISGFPMTLQNNVQRPFVTNLIPNVGGQAVNVVREGIRRGEFTTLNGKIIPAGALKGNRASTSATTPSATAARTTPAQPLVDAAPLPRAEREAQASAQERERTLAIQTYLRKGKEAETKGKPGVAKLYYQMAARKADGDLKREALASLDRVTN